MSEGLRRYTRTTRWFHAGVYVFTLVTLGTGLWIHFGQEGKVSFLGSLLNRPDIVIHEDAGWALLALAIAVLAFGFRGVGTFVLDSVRYRRGDEKWLAQWPRSALTGRFRRHEGHFDPGQRIANLVLAAGLIVLVTTGIALIFVHGGSWFVRLAFVHRWEAFLLTPVIVGHIIVASGVLPGYRGVWRSMHWGGRVSADAAQRLWPAWAEERVIAPESTDEIHRQRTG